MLIYTTAKLKDLTMYIMTWISAEDCAKQGKILCNNKITCAVKCDGVPQCPLGEDEANCSKYFIVILLMIVCQYFIRTGPESICLLRKSSFFPTRLCHACGVYTNAVIDL